MAHYPISQERKEALAAATPAGWMTYLAANGCYRHAPRIGWDGLDYERSIHSDGCWCIGRTVSVADILRP